MHESIKNKKIFASIILAALIIFLAFAFFPFVNALLGALILYALFRPLYLKFNKKIGLKKGVSASIVILLSLAIIVIPLSFLITVLIGEVSSIFSDTDSITNQIEAIDQVLPFIDLDTGIQEILANVGQFIQKLLVSAVQNVTHILISLIITFFVLFYMLVNTDNLSKAAYKWIPFNKKNTKKLLHEFHTVTYSGLITTGLIALIQGIFLGIGFWIFGIPGAVFWGFIGTILAFLPLIGIPLIWVPAGLFQIVLHGNNFAGIGILIWGVVLSVADNFLRPIFQKRIGKMHPLVSLIGVFIGIPIFGIIGIIVGPLLLSYFFLTIQMFNEEYLSNH